MSDLGVAFWGVGCWGTLSFWGSYIFWCIGREVRLSFTRENQLGGKGDPLWNVCVPAGVCVLNVCTALFSVSEEMRVFSGQLSSRVRRNQRNVVSRHALYYRLQPGEDIPGYFGGTPETLEDSLLNV